MADDAATRKRRSRRHKAGDHSLCLPGKCGAKVAVDQPPAPELVTNDEATDGPITAQLEEWAATLRFAESDVRQPMVAAALKLAAHLDDASASAAPAVAKELRQYVAWIGESGAEADELDELRARRAQRRVDVLLREA